MLELLQKTLLYIEQQNEWLSYIQSTIQEKEQHYKSLHFIISTEIIKQIRKQDVVDADDVKMELDEIVVKEEYCDVTDIEITPIINLEEPRGGNTNVDDGTSIDQLESDEDLKYEKNNAHVAVIKENTYLDGTEEGDEHRDDGGVDVASYVFTNHQLVEHDVDSSIDKAAVFKDHQNTSDEYMKLSDQDYDAITKGKEKLNVLQCICSKTVSSRLAITTTHSPLHNGEKPQICKHCKASFSRLDNPNVHLQKQIDKKSLIDLSHQNSHLHVHSTQKLYKCHHCGKFFSELRNRNRHLRIHTGEKPYKCHYCEKSFSEVGSRNRHVRIHTGEKPYKCAHCDKAFSDAGNRNRHLRTHASYTQR